jgi:hypothetical protein
MDNFNSADSRNNCLEIKWSIEVNRVGIPLYKIFTAVGKSFCKNRLCFPSNEEKTAITCSVQWLLFQTCPHILRPL